MPDRFPVGLILGAFICTAIAIGVLSSAVAGRSAERRLSAITVAAGLSWLAAAVLLLLSAVDTRWVFRVGPPLAAGIIVVAGITAAINYWSRRNS